ncbi:hypothetical protein, partial [Bradyrhizobium elkanii]|uniref:hypothetical protein n=1 Tax=Bradyrhizobium elkanii TaxID=29448 RepID=UPI001AEF0EEB
QFDPLAGGQLAARVLRLDALFAAAKPCTDATFFKSFNCGNHTTPPVGPRAGLTPPYTSDPRPEKA